MTDDAQALADTSTGTIAKVPKKSGVARNGVLIQFGVRIPRPLHRRVRAHCIAAELTVRDFVAEAIAEKLQRARPRPAR
jgi:hypothetical protein